MVGGAFDEEEEHEGDERSQKNIQIMIDTAKIIENLPDVDCDLNLIELAENMK